MAITFIEHKSPTEYSNYVGQSITKLQHNINGFLLRFPSPSKGQGYSWHLTYRPFIRSYEMMFNGVKTPSIYDLRFVFSFDDYRYPIKKVSKFRRIYRPLGVMKIVRPNHNKVAVLVLDHVPHLGFSIHLKVSEINRSQRLF